MVHLGTGVSNSMNKVLKKKHQSTNLLWSMSGYCDAADQTRRLGKKVVKYTLLYTLKIFGDGSKHIYWTIWTNAISLKFIFNFLGSVHNVNSLLFVNESILLQEIYFCKKLVSLKYLLKLQRNRYISNLDVCL